ncbi:MAG: extracellular matrix regulator RemB [bacterium]
MYVHLGGDVVVTTDEIVAILDPRGVSGSEISREFVARAREDGRVHEVGGGTGRSLVVTTRGVYVSGLSTATLARRILGGAKHQAGQGVCAFDAPSGP